MRYDKRIVSKLVGLILSSIATLLLVSAICVATHAQEDKPITKGNLLSSLKLGKQEKKSMAWYIKMIEQHGVDFRMTNEDEKEIRQAGTYQGAKELSDLIAAVRDNYPAQRLRVSLFKYAPCNQYFDQFEALIGSKVSALPSKFVSKGVQYKYVARLYLVKEEKYFSMSLEEANRYWEETHSLQLLHGMCSIKDNNVYVFSLVYLGDLHGSLTTPIRIEFKVDPEEYGNTKDIHSVLILYSLAQEAQARGQSKDLVISYLSEALSLVAQIKYPNSTTLQPIKSAIEGMLLKLGASDLLVLPAQ